MIQSPPTYPMLSMATSDPRFTPHMGNNLVGIRTLIRRGGAVSFAKHLGRPLTPELWEDVTERLGAMFVRVYRPNSEEWTDGCSDTCIIRLDNEGLVRDIEWHPPLSVAPEDKQ